MRDMNVTFLDEAEWDGEVSFCTTTLCLHSAEDVDVALLDESEWDDEVSFCTTTLCLHSAEG